MAHMDRSKLAQIRHQIKENSVTVPTQKFTRKPFSVNAIQVTEENLNDVAKWCGGTVLTESLEPDARKYIKVAVHKPLNERQTKAFVGDWVLTSNKGFKAYTDKAFKASFVPAQASIPIPHGVVGKGQIQADFEVPADFYQTNASYDRTQAQKTQKEADFRGVFTPSEVVGDDLVTANPLYIEFGLNDFVAEGVSPYEAEQAMKRAGNEWLKANPGGIVHYIPGFVKAL